MLLRIDDIVSGMSKQQEEHPAAQLDDQDQETVCILLFELQWSYALFCLALSSVMPATDKLVGSIGCPPHGRMSSKNKPNAEKTEC